MFVNRYVNRKCVMWFTGKKSFKVTSNPPNLTVLFDEFFGLNNKRVRRANNGRRHCPSRPQNSNGSVPVFFWSSFDLKSSFWVFWNGFVMKKFDRKCWPRSCFQDFLSFSVKWPCYSQLDSMKQFCFDDFFYREIATNLGSRYSGKTQQIDDRFCLFTIIVVHL